MTRTVKIILVTALALAVIAAVAGVRWVRAWDWSL
jgi:hypothetical protein